MAKYSLIKNEVTSSGDMILWIESHGLWNKVYVVRFHKGDWFYFEDGRWIEGELRLAANGFLRKLYWEDQDEEAVSADSESADHECRACRSLCGKTFSDVFVEIVE